MTEEATQAAPSAPETTAPAADETTNLQAVETPEPAPEPAAEPAVETAETTEEPSGEEPEGRKKPTGSQRLKRRLAMIEADHLAVLAENEALKQRTIQQRPDGKPGVDREPTEQDFPNDYFAFEAARNQWTVRQAVRDEVAKARQTDRSVAERELHQERLEAYEDVAEQARERIPDFDKVVRSAADIKLKPELVEELLASEKSALLQYHLAKNPDKVRDLNGMTGKELAREIGRLESRVHLPTPKKATEAAPPPTQIKGGAAQAFDPFTTDDMNAYVAWRRKQTA